MSNIQTHTIPIPDGISSDLTKIKDVIEEHSSKFDDYILSAYSGDARYSVFDGSFEVTSISEDFFEFTAQVQYYAGCAGQNDVFDVDGSVEYQIENDQLSFELDETVWRYE